MKKYFLFLTLTISLISLATTSYSQTVKIITLKDGSVLKGKVIQLKNNIYTFETSNLGRVEIPESNILSITSPGAPGLTQQQYTQSNNTQKAQLKNQVQQIQGSILSDPGLMSDIQNILNDKEVQTMFSDPAFMNDVLSYDQEKIQQNDSVQNLMNNPKMKNLMNKVLQTISAQK